MKKYLFVFLLITLVSKEFFCQSLQFEHLTIADGLSQSTVFDIYQDHNGFFWFSTEEGLNRYDGRKFQVFKNEEGNYSSISSNRVNTVFEDSQKNLWVGTEHGLNMFDAVNRKFHRFFIDSTITDFNPSNRIKSITESPAGILWVGTSRGLFKFDKKTKRFSLFGIIDGGDDRLLINHLFADREDKDIIWGGTTGAGLVKINTATDEFEILTLNKSCRINEAQNVINKINYYNSNLYYLGSDKGVVVFNKNENKVIENKIFNISRHSFSEEKIGDILFTENGDHWYFAKHEGIVHYIKETGAYEEIRHEFDPEHGISNNRMESAFLDSSGIIWIGTYSGGINKYDPGVVSFSYMYDNIEKGSRFTSNEIWSFCEDHNGKIWVGTNRGLNRLDRQTGKIENFTPSNSGLSAFNIFSLIEDNNNYLWIGNWRGLDRYDLKKKKFKNFLLDGDQPKVSARDAVIELYIDTDSNLWVGTYKGLKKYIPDTEEFEVYEFSRTDSNTISNNMITAIIEDSEGFLWVGTNHGLNKFDKQTGKAVRYYNNPDDKTSLSHNRVQAVYKDSDNNIWIATNGGGINKYDKKNNNFKCYSVAEGLPNEVAYGILEDSNGHLWISTNFGLSCFIPKTETFINYTSKNGLQSNEFNFNAFYKTRDNEMFFGGVNGFNSFYPDQIKHNNKIPHTFISELKIGNKRIYPDNSDKIKTDILFADRIELLHNDFPFSLEFSSLNYSQPLKNQFVYKLEGFSDDWISLGTNNLLTINNLDYGTYRLIVKSSNNYNIWNEKGKSIEIIVSPPVYSTIWAKIFYVLIIFLAIFGFIKYETRHNKKKMIIMKRSEELKTEFLAQMSHEIRTPINTILSFASLIQEEVEDKVEPETRECFSVMDRAGRRIIRTIDLILDMSQIQTKTYEPHYKSFDIKEILEQQFVEYKPGAEKKSIKMILELDGDDFSVFADEYTVGQIIQNLIDNAIKYTSEGSIKIILEKNNLNHTVLKVEDTGIGIAEEYIAALFEPFSQEETGYTRSFEGNGLGLALVKNYCDLNDAEISVQSIKDVGSTFMVVFKK